MTKDEFIKRCEEIANEYAIYGIIPLILNGKPTNGAFPECEHIPLENLATDDAGKIYDFLEEYDLFKKEATEEVYPTPTKISEILMVEDGSCDVENLKKQGYKIIVYRQGSKPPYFMEDKKEKHNENN